MRSIKFIVLFFIGFNKVFAQTSPFAVVSPNGNTQLSFSLDEAITKSGANDIIYAPGGSFAIGDIYLTKKVTIIGVGHHPDSAQATGRTSFDGNIYISPDASGSALIGFFLSGIIVLQDNGNPISILVEKCNVGQITHNIGGANYTNITILHNVIREHLTFTTNPGHNNINIIGNIFEGYIQHVQNANISNNIFLLPGNAATSLTALTNCNITNNIFTGTGTNILNGGTNLTFTNNIFGSTPTGITNTGSNSGNKFNISRSALFLNDVGGAEFSYGANYRLRAGSPGSNAGVDGKDAGLFGGQLPFIDGAIPATPRIAFREVAPQTGANGTLQVRFRVTTNQ